MKKVTKIIIGILCFLMLIWLMMFAVDYNRCASMEKPIFVVSQNVMANSETFLGIGYTVEVETYFDKKYGKEVICAVEMRVFGKVIVAAIS